MQALRRGGELSRSCRRGPGGVIELGGVRGAARLLV